MQNSAVSGGHLVVVGQHQNGGTLLIQSGEFRRLRLGSALIEGTGGFIGEQNFRLAYHTPVNTGSLELRGGLY